MPAPLDMVAARPGDPPPATVLLRLATAYQASKVVHLAARFGLADLLAGGPRSAEELAAATGTHAPSLHRLLRALAAFGLFGETEDGRFALAAPGECLRDGVPGSVRPLVLMWGHEDFHRTWDDLEHCVATGETAIKHLFGCDDTFTRYAADPVLGTVFNAGMTVMSAMATDAVVAGYDFSGCGTIVDVGGGQGRLLSGILRATPGRAKGVLLDLPAVVEAAPRLLAEAGLADRCEVVGGDMFAAVPEGGDLYVLKSVIHDWDDERSIAILKNCRRGMGERPARLLLVERVLPERMEPGPVAQSHALSDLNMLLRTGGRERTEGEFRALLEAAHLRLLRVIPTGTPASLIEAGPH